MAANSAPKTIGIVGARGFTGAELITLLANHPGFNLEFVSSRELAGQRLADHIPAWQNHPQKNLRFESLSPEQVAQKNVDLCVLALPNQIASRFVEAIEAQTIEAQAIEVNDSNRSKTPTDTIILDISADHRFDPDWTYGLTEFARPALAHTRRISNPGCYATGIQFGLKPVIDLAIAPPQVFGVSGYSGAGATPSPKNDLDILRDNLMPYSLTGHIHEREATHHLGHQIYFSPHVAPYFRGITLTVSVQLARPHTPADIRARFDALYHDEPLIQLLDHIPLVKDNAATHTLRIGGWSLDPRGEHLAFVVTLDNLLKGAATQALQNANLACGFDEFTAIL